MKIRLTGKKKKKKNPKLDKNLLANPLGPSDIYDKKFMQNEIVLRFCEDRSIPNIGLKHNTHRKETEHIQERLNPHNHTKNPIYLHYSL